jgi:hypothetical protein
VANQGLARPLDHPGEDLAELLVDPLEDRAVERLLRIPVVVEARDVHAGAGPRSRGSTPVEALDCEDLLGGREDAGLGRSRGLAAFLDR